MINLTHNSFLCVYFSSLHVSSNLVLIIRRINCVNKTSGTCHSVSVTVSCSGRQVLSDLHTKRSPTESDMYQVFYWCNLFSWWWERGCSKHVENWNKHIENNCASIWSFTKNNSRSQWPRGLSRRSPAASLLRLWVRIPPEAWMFVCCECCVLSSRGLCDELITRPKESYRQWRVDVCDQEASKTRRLKPATGLWKYNYSGL
jgi:hypothetical protein